MHAINPALSPEMYYVHEFDKNIQIISSSKKSQYRVFRVLLLTRIKNGDGKNGQPFKDWVLFLSFKIPR